MFNFFFPLFNEVVSISASVLSFCAHGASAALTRLVWISFAVLFYTRDSNSEQAAHALPGTAGIIPGKVGLFSNFSCGLHSLLLNVR